MISLRLRNLPEIKVSLRGFAKQAPDTSGRLQVLWASFFTGSVCYVFHLPQHFLHLLSNALTKLAKTSVAACRSHPSNKSSRAEDKTSRKGCQPAGHPPKYTRSITGNTEENRTSSIECRSLITSVTYFFPVLSLTLANRGKKPW